MLWGLTYIISEQIYKKISVISAIGISTLFASIIMLLIAHSSGYLKTDLVTISRSNKLLLLIIVEIVIFAGADFLIGLSIAHKYATVAGLIEISYPIFIALFALLFFKENQFNLGALIGGLLIFTGITLVYFFNK